MHLAGHPSRDKGINDHENSFCAAGHCLHKKLIEGKVFPLGRCQELLLEESCSFLFLDKFMHGDQSLRKAVCFCALGSTSPFAIPQMVLCVLRPLNCTITNRCTLCLVSVFKEKPPNPPSRAQASIQSRPTAEYSYVQSILRLLRNGNFLLLMVTYGKVWPFFLCSYHGFSLPLCALLGQ